MRFYDEITVNALLDVANHRDIPRRLRPTLLKLQELSKLGKNAIRKPVAYLAKCVGLSRSQWFEHQAALVTCGAISVEPQKTSGAMNTYSVIRVKTLTQIKSIARQIWQKARKSARPVFRTPIGLIKNKTSMKSAFAPSTPSDQFTFEEIELINSGWSWNR